MLIAIEIGEKWLTGAAVQRSGYQTFFENHTQNGLKSLLDRPVQVPFAFGENTGSEELTRFLEKLVDEVLAGSGTPEGIAISTPGEISYHGDKVIRASPPFNILEAADWKTALEKKYSCPVFILNSADAAMIGLAELGSLTGERTIGVILPGRLPALSIWRNGRRWRPGGIQPVTGVEVPPFTSFPASLPAEADLGKIAASLRTAIRTYNIEKIYVTVVEEQPVHDNMRTVESELRERMAGLQADLTGRLKDLRTDRVSAPDVEIVVNPDSLQLLGCVAVIAGETLAKRLTHIPKYNAIETEVPYDRSLLLHQKSAAELVEILWKAEEEAGKSLRDSLPVIAATAERVYRSLADGGRLIYVGAGTSGRIAAMDAVEIPCTYGLAKDRALAVISGGVADASIDIEYNFEEDASSVPEMLLLNIRANDVVIGISASGSAYYVQSALALAKSRGAHTVMVRNNDPGDTSSFCDAVIALNSNHEVVAGSTRMKAGTATKKTLNFISSVAMIRLGKVKGSYMIDVACINAKLMSRAAKILRILYKLDEHEAAERLKKHGLHLKRVIDEIEE